MLAQIEEVGSDVLVAVVFLMSAPGLSFLFTGKFHKRL